LYAALSAAVSATFGPSNTDLLKKQRMLYATSVVSSTVRIIWSIKTGLVKKPMKTPVQFFKIESNQAPGIESSPIPGIRFITPLGDPASAFSSRLEFVPKIPQSFVNSDQLAISGMIETESIAESVTQTQLQAELTKLNIKRGAIKRKLGYTKTFLNNFHIPGVELVYET
jgi:hypothetical protein